MEPKTAKFPHEGDLVLCEVTSIQPNCAFAKLKEYEGLDGMIHISEVSNSWIKNIRTFVREGKEVVCKVMSVDPARRHISLSLRRVSTADKGEKYEQIKREKKSAKMLERVAERLKTGTGPLRERLAREFGEVYFGFEAAARSGEAALTEKGIPGDQAAAVTEIAKASIVFPEVSISGTLTIQSFEPDGIETIKGILAKVESLGAQVHYISAPKYRIKLTASDYKSAERQLKSVLDFALEAIKKSKGAGDFTRSQKE